MTPLEIALHLAARGLPVFPCERSKRPCIPKGAGGRGLHDATTDAVSIRRLFCHPGATLVGVPTGEVSGFDVLDLDYHHGAATWEQANQDRLPETRVHITPSGGQHRLFRHAPGVRNSASRIAAGVDVRGTGGYAVFPPSSGYGVMKDTALAHWPDWLLPHALPPPKPLRHEPQAGWKPVTSERLEAVIQSALTRVRNAADGAKHVTLRNTALLLGGIAAQAGFTDAMAIQWLLDALPGTVCDWRSAKQTAAWGLEHGRTNPIEQSNYQRHPSDPRRQETARTAFRLLRQGKTSTDLLVALHRQNNQRTDPEPPQVCRRLQLLRRWSHDESDDEQVFS